MGDSNTRQLWRRGANVGAASNAFASSLDLDGTTKGGGRERKNKHPRTGNPQPQSYSYDQPNNNYAPTGQYPPQSQATFPQYGAYGQTNNLCPSAPGAPQYSSPPPQQPQPPPQCACTVCKYCVHLFNNCYDSASRRWLCQYHPGHQMKWHEPSLGHHACPAIKNQNPAPPNQQQYSGPPQYGSGSGPPYPCQGYNQQSGQAYGGATRGFHQSTSPPPPTQQPYGGYQQQNYVFGGAYTQEPEQASPGAASEYYHPNTPNYSWPG